MEYKSKSFFRILRENKILLLMLLPATIYTIIFSYIPMEDLFYFKNYRYADGMFVSPWVGLEILSFYYYLENCNQ